jgi:hypothetical protein
MVHGGLRNQNDLWAGLGWVSPHEALIGETGRMCSLPGWLLGMQLDTVRRGGRSSKAHPERATKWPQRLSETYISKLLPGPDLGLSAQPGWEGRRMRVGPDGCFISFADKAPKGAAGERTQAAEKDPSPLDKEKDPGSPDPKKDPDPSSLKKDAKAPVSEKGDGVPVQPLTSSQSPEGEGDGGGGPAEGSAGQPAALPQQTATAEAGVKKRNAEQGPLGSQGVPGESKVGKKAAEGQAAARRGSPAFLHSPSCPAIISR